MFGSDVISSRPDGEEDGGGFIQWALRKPGFIFEYLHGTEDLADTASKRMERLFRSAGVIQKLYKTFHGLRHLKIVESRDAGFANRTTCLRAGHELETVYDRYGGLMLRPVEISLMSNEPLPDDIDWSAFLGLDFEMLSVDRPVPRRKPRNALPPVLAVMISRPALPSKTVAR